MKNLTIRLQLFALAVVLMAMLIANIASAQTSYNGGGFTIPNGNPSGVSSTINVPANYTITKATVAVGISHDRIGDLVFTLTAPDGRQLKFIDRPRRYPGSTLYCTLGLSGSYTFADGSYAGLESACDLYTGIYTNFPVGTYLPKDSFSFFIGGKSQGNWTLNVSDNDNATAVTGSVGSWTLTLTPSLSGGGVTDPADYWTSEDITFLDGTVSAGVLTVQVQTRNLLNDFNLHDLQIFMDTDQNPNTGDAKTGEIAGADYRISASTGFINSFVLYQLPTQNSGVAIGTNFSNIPGASGTVSANVLTLKLPVTAINNTTAVDLFALIYDPDPYDVWGNGDRCPDSGALNTSTTTTVVRRPAYPVDFTFTDVSGAGTQDLTSARFRTFDDQFQIVLTFASAVDTRNTFYDLAAIIKMDSDRNILTGFRMMGLDVPTWGADVELSFTISNKTPVVLLNVGLLSDYLNFRPPTNDGRWQAVGNQLILTASLSVFDAWFWLNQNNQNIATRRQTDGRMITSVSASKLLLPPIDFMPENGKAFDLSLGQEIAPLAWDPAQTVSAADPVETGVGGEDFIQIDAEIVSGNLVVKGILSKWQPTDHDNWFIVYLDTDMNVNTGVAVSNNMTPGQPAIGADYQIHVFSVDGVPIFYSAKLLRPDNALESHDAMLYVSPASLGPGYFTVTMPLANIGNPSQFRFYVAAGRTNLYITEFAPPAPMTFSVPPAISLNDVTVTEGNSGTINASFTATLSAASTQTVTATYATANGTAIAPGDYTAASGTLAFAAGTTAQTITVSVKGDVLDEANETFLVNLTNPTNATLGDAQGQCTITDDDAAPTLAINDVTVTEGNTGTVTAVFTVSLSAASGQQVTVNYATANGTATANMDYIPRTTGTITFSPGTKVRTVGVAVNGDVIDEVNETFFVNLTSPTNATIADNQGQGTIADDDLPPTLSINDASVAEGNSGTVTAVFTVSLSTISGQQVTVNYSTASGTATANKDYIPRSTGTITFSPGTIIRTVGVAVYGDIVVESNETFFVNLTNPVNATMADAQGLGTIVNDDVLFNPTDDAYVKSTAATSNFDTATTLQLQQSTTILNSYLKFVVSGLSSPVKSAKLRLKVTVSDTSGGSVYAVSNNYLGTTTAWTQSGLNYGNAPSMSGLPLSSVGTVFVNQIVEFDVTAAITGNGTFSFGMKNASIAAVQYSSKEGAAKPELLIQITPSTATAAPSAAAESDTAIAKIAAGVEQLPQSLALAPNYPNPFNPATTISYSIPEDMNATLKVYNMAGQEVATLAEGYHERGVYNVTFEASRFTSGVYFAVLQAGAARQVRRMTLVK
jgi:subtilisin-like proprotein convertase family protein